MTLKHLWMATFFLAFVLSVAAAPLQDISKTSVDFEEAKGNVKDDNEHLLVTVTRVDDLVNGDGSILAERIMAVQVSFDVVGNQLHCNGVPIELGVSNIQVEAQVLSDAKKLTVESDEELALLEDSFDLGLASVQVTATLLDESTDEQGVPFRRIAVQEKITEINHEKVVQTNEGQQLLDIFDNGRVDRWSVDPITGFLLPERTPTDDNSKQQQEEEERRIEDDILTPWMGNKDNGDDKCVNLIDTFVQWWGSQSNILRSILTGALCASFFATALFVRHLLVSVNSAYGALPLYDDEDGDKNSDDNDAPPFYEHAVDGADDDEKQPFLTS